MSSMCTNEGRKETMKLYPSYNLIFNCKYYFPCKFEYPQYDGYGDGDQ